MEHNKKDLTAKELSYYSRHVLLPEIGHGGQKKLKNAKVLVVGAGGLGCPILQYLAGAGVGTIGIADSDNVEISNLHRQVLFGSSDSGNSKAITAAARLQDLNPHISIKTHVSRVTSNNAMDLFKDYDLIADATDNLPSRYLINDACVLLGKPFIYGSVYRFEGQLSTFNLIGSDGHTGPNYRDLFPNPPKPELVPGCSDTGVMGVLPGIIGTMQAAEALKIITGTGEPLSGNLFMFDSRSFQSWKIKIKKQPDNPLTGVNPEITELIDYDAFCGLNNGHANVREVTAAEFRKWKEKGLDYQLIDIREHHERTIMNIGGDFIPLNKLIDHVKKISRDKNVVLYCMSGQRSINAIKKLQDEYGFQNLYSLKGGMEAFNH